MEPKAGMEAHGSGVRLPFGYSQLFDAASEVFAADERVRGAWVHGSVARGDADAASDLDVIVAVADDDLPSFAAGWRERLAAVTDTVMARPSFGSNGSWLAVTPRGERFDLWVEAASQVAVSPVRDRRPIFDRDALSAVVPAPPAPAPRDEDVLNRLRGSYIAVAAAVPLADDLFLHQLIWTLRWVLYNAYVELNRPLPATLGLKQWSAKLTAAQRATFLHLPVAGDAGPVLDALAEVLGPLPDPLPEPTMATAVFPPDGMIRGLTVSSAEPGTWVRHVAEEQLALHLYLTVAVHRDDWLLGVVGANDARRLLYELYLDANGRPPATAPADWSGRLTPGQRSVLLAIPTAAPTRDSVVTAHLTGRETFAAQGRALLGDQWPAPMQEAVWRHVDAFLGDS
jgi:predicted nucleotidyltransferase